MARPEQLYQKVWDVLMRAYKEKVFLAELLTDRQGTLNKYGYQLNVDELKQLDKVFAEDTMKTGNWVMDMMNRLNLPGTNAPQPPPIW